MKTVIEKGNYMQVARVFLFTLIFFAQGNLAKEPLNVNYTSSIEPIVINVMHEWILTIESVDGHPITNADVTVEGGMPEHNHGLPTQPKVTKNLGNGQYLLQGVRFHMPGLWEIRATIRVEGDEHNVIFPLNL